MLIPYHGAGVLAFEGYGYGVCGIKFTRAHALVAVQEMSMKMLRSMDRGSLVGMLTAQGMKQSQAEMMADSMSNMSDKQVRAYVYVCVRVCMKEGAHARVRMYKYVCTWG